jgi:RES domain
MTLYTPPTPFPEIHRETLPAGSLLHRVHDGGYASNSFNPGKGRPTRFAPLIRKDGSHVPTAYAAERYVSAAYETIFHAVQHDAPRKTVSLTNVEPLCHAIIRLGRALVLATLFEPDLNGWKLTRTDLIDTFASAYPATAAWALAIHDSHKDVDGLVWTSRRCDSDRAYLLFGDRVAAKDLAIVERVMIISSNDRLSALRAFGKRSEITLTL